MKKQIITSLTILGSLVFLSGCSTSLDDSIKKDNTQTKISKQYLRDFTLKNNRIDTFLLRESTNDNFSKVYFTLGMYNSNLVNNSVHMIDDLVTLSKPEYFEKYKNIKPQYKFIKKNSQLGFFLKTSFEKNIKDEFANIDTNVKRDKKLILLDIDVRNFNEKPLVLSSEFVKANFKNHVAFWYNEDKRIIKKGQSERLVIVVGRSEHFKVKKQSGSTGLNFNTKRVINKQYNTN